MWEGAWSGLHFRRVIQPAKGRIDWKGTKLEAEWTASGDVAHIMEATMKCKKWKVSQLKRYLIERGEHLGGSVIFLSDFGSGHDLAVCGFEPPIRLATGSAKPALNSLSSCLSAPPQLTLSLSLSLKNKNKNLKKRKKERKRLRFKRWNRAWRLINLGRR